MPFDFVKNRVGAVAAVSEAPSILAVVAPLEVKSKASPAEYIKAATVVPSIEECSLPIGAVVPIPTLPVEVKANFDTPLT